MSEPIASQMSESMNRLWVKFLPQMEERVNTLESAAAQLSGGSPLSDEEQIKAAAEAHKLAGVLGTFGLNAGTELAREAETLYGGQLPEDPVKVVRLREIAEQLKAMIASRT